METFPQDDGLATAADAATLSECLRQCGGAGRTRTLRSGPKGKSGNGTDAPDSRGFLGVAPLTSGSWARSAASWAPRGHLVGTSGEMKERALTAFYERLAAAESALRRIQDDLRLG